MEKSGWERKAGFGVIGILYCRDKDIVNKEVNAFSRSVSQQWKDASGEMHFTGPNTKATFRPCIHRRTDEQSVMKSNILLVSEFVYIGWTRNPAPRLTVTSPLPLQAEAASMSDRKTMTLNLTEREMAVLEELSRKKELSKTAVVRQALRLYQVIDARLSEGEKLFFEDEQTQRRSEVMVL